MSDPSKVVLAEIRRESQDIYNRIHSIHEDSAFVSEVINEYAELPLLRSLGHSSFRSFTLLFLHNHSKSEMWCLVYRPRYGEYCWNKCIPQS